MRPGTSRTATSPSASPACCCGGWPKLSRPGSTTRLCVNACWSTPTCTRSRPIRTRSRRGPPTSQTNPLLDGPLPQPRRPPSCTTRRASPVSQPDGQRWRSCRLSQLPSAYQPPRRRRRPGGEPTQRHPDDDVGVGVAARCLVGMSIPVFTHPRQMALTRTPRPPHSAARVRVSPMSPCLLAWYAERSATPSRPATEATFTMLPEPAASISRPSSGRSRNGPSRLTSSTRRPCCPVVCSSPPVSGPTRHTGTPGPGTKYLERVRSAQIVTEAPTSEKSVLRWCCRRRLELVDLAQTLHLGGQRI